MASQSWTEIQPSEISRNTLNPIRGLLYAGAKPQSTPKSTKEVINMSIGDPTVYGNLKTPQKVLDAVHAATDDFKSHGYGPAMGHQFARQAVADRFSEPEHDVNYKFSDVFLASGGSGSIEFALIALCGPGDTVLTPLPGFTLYNTTASSHGISVKGYNLLPEKNWEVDLDHLESLIDSTTKAILINNPSNPCGSNWSKEHILAIIAICEKHKIPLISDEIYEHLVFGDEVFYSTASLSKTVPVLTLGGIAKRYLVPGWRMGWVTLHDPLNVLGSIRLALQSISAILNGPNTIIQFALREILLGDFNAAHQKYLIENLEESAAVTEKRANSIKGLRAIKPQGAMYLMVLFDPENFDSAIQTDIDFFHTLLWEENVEVLPGSIFGCPNSLRIVIAPPKDKINEAFDRIEEFCARHSK
ncbi:hypothetical protein BB560_001164 [Smittium megazygosporum]|uniref:Aminotransferase class I/classII large domain-containing protein n=1 Tax=Smittium megazygosporum TaxID=133381 RepID=A0A2T9ZIK3_9FUNG|nr:hypothetical protein BB560_001164 [Smittium megazygosporum]